MWMTQWMSININITGRQSAQSQWKEIQIPVSALIVQVASA